MLLIAGADPGFLEKGFICIKVCVCWGGGGGCFADFITFLLNNKYPMKMK